MHRDLYDEQRRIAGALRRIRAATEADAEPLAVAVHALAGEPEPFADVVGRESDGADVRLRLGPFQVVTLRVSRR